MRWLSIFLAGALSSSGTSASLDPVLKAKFNLSPRSHLYATNEKKYAVPEPFENRNGTTPNLFARSFNQLFPRQTAGRCGTDAGGSRCPDNLCCSVYNYCGSSDEHCLPIAGCQEQFGRCGSAPTASPSPSPTPTPTPTPTPLPSSSSIIVPSSSAIIPSSSSSLPPLPSGTLIPSTNGQCGNVTTCSGSTFGSCCSEYYFCGSTPNFCGDGCRSAFGTCNGLPPLPSSSVPVPPLSSSAIPVSSSTRPTPTPSPTTPTPTPSPSSTTPAVPTNVSTNGRCGEEGNGMTCQGSTFGRCCSSYGYCGSQDDYCRVSYGCRPAFGSCGS